MEIRTHSVSELLEKLRQVKLVGFGQPRIYENVRLQIEMVPPNHLVPCQNYYLRENVEQIVALRRRVLDEHKIDVLQMYSELGDIGWVEFKLGEEWVPFLPPVVEIFSRPADSGDPWPIKKGMGTAGLGRLINDGIHRVQTARELGLGFVGVVTAAKPDWPYYALPVKRGWDGMEGLKDEAHLEQRIVTQGSGVPFEKKSYRLPEKALYKQLYRDFNAVFPGVQKERPSQFR